MDGMNGDWRWFWVCLVSLFVSGTLPILAGKIPLEFRDASEMDDLFKLDLELQKKTAMDYIAEANLFLDKTSDKNGMKMQ